MIDTAFIIKCIRDDDVHRFYCRKEWKQVRDEVLSIDHNECQKCKSRGKYNKADIVHHIHHLKDYPELALNIYDDEGHRNLISLCQSCHEEEHPEERHKFRRKEDSYRNEERW